MKERWERGRIIKEKIGTQNSWKERQGGKIEKLTEIK
jgi:hypothetical protein